jgi:hypothetical protein
LGRIKKWDFNLPGCGIIIHLNSPAPGQNQIPDCRKQKPLIVLIKKGNAKAKLSAPPATKRFGINTGPAHKAIFYSAFLLVSGKRAAEGGSAFFFPFFF